MVQWCCLLPSCLSRACVQVVSLGSTRLLEPECYPTFTLLGQAWGSVRLAWRALRAARPQVCLLGPGSGSSCVGVQCGQPAALFAGEQARKSAASCIS